MDGNGKPQQRKEKETKDKCSQRCQCTVNLKEKLTFELAELVSNGKIYENILNTWDSLPQDSQQSKQKVAEKKSSYEPRKESGGAYSWKEVLQEVCKPKCGQHHDWRDDKLFSEGYAHMPKCKKRELWNWWKVYWHMMRMERANDEGVFKDYHLQDMV